VPRRRGWERIAARRRACRGAERGAGFFGSLGTWAGSGAARRARATKTAGSSRWHAPCAFRCRRVSWAGSLRHAIATLAAIGLLAAAPAAASLIGTTATSTVAGCPGLFADPGSATVGAGVEFLDRNSASFVPFSGDVGATSFVFAAAGGRFCSVPDREISVTFAQTIAGISVSLASGATDLAVGDFTFSGQTLNIFVASVAVLPGTLATVELTFATPSEVPAPAALALFGAGLLGLGLARRAALSCSCAASTTPHRVRRAHAASGRR
jgi:hypothetical protein